MVRESYLRIYNPWGNIENNSKETRDLVIQIRNIPRKNFMTIDESTFIPPSLPEPKIDHSSDLNKKNRVVSAGRGPILDTEKINNPHRIQWFSFPQGFNRRIATILPNCRLEISLVRKIGDVAIIDPKNIPPELPGYHVKFIISEIELYIYRDKEESKIQEEVLLQAQQQAMQQQAMQQQAMQQQALIDDGSDNIRRSSMLSSSITMLSGVQEENLNPITNMMQTPGGITGMMQTPGGMVGGMGSILNPASGLGITPLATGMNPGMTRMNSGDGITSKAGGIMTMVTNAGLNPPQQGAVTAAAEMTKMRSVAQQQSGLFENIPEMPFQMEVTEIPVLDTTIKERMSTDQYLIEFGIQNLFTEMVGFLYEDKPENPRLALANYLFHSYEKDRLCEEIQKEKLGEVKELFLDDIFANNQRRQTAVQEKDWWRSELDKDAIQKTKEQAFQKAQQDRSKEKRASEKIHGQETDVESEIEKSMTTIKSFLSKRFHTQAFSEGFDSYFDSNNLQSISENLNRLETLIEGDEEGSTQGSKDRVEFRKSNSKDRPRRSLSKGSTGGSRRNSKDLIDGVTNSSAKDPSGKDKDANWDDPSGSADSPASPSSPTPDSPASSPSSPIGDFKNLKEG